jgi:hypothetical protein
MAVVLCTAVVSAHFLCKNVRSENVSVTEFREEVLKGLLNHENVVENTNERRAWNLSFFQEGRSIQSY